MIYNIHDSTTRVCKLGFGKTTSLKSFHWALQKLSVVSPQATANQIESILLTVCLQRHSTVTHSWDSPKPIPIKHFYLRTKVQQILRFTFQPACFAVAFDFLSSCFSALPQSKQSETSASKATHTRSKSIDSKRSWGSCEGHPLRLSSAPACKTRPIGRPHQREWICGYASFMPISCSQSNEPFLAAL